jgi:hypothetical protein
MAPPWRWRCTLSTDSYKRYVPTGSGTFHHTLQLQLGTQTGNFLAEWIEPSTGTVLSSVPFTWNGASYTLPRSPDYNFDIALRIKRTS